MLFFLKINCLYLDAIVECYSFCDWLLPMSSILMFHLTLILKLLQFLFWEGGVLHEEMKVITEPYLKGEKAPLNQGPLCPVNRGVSLPDHV